MIPDFTTDPPSLALANTSNLDRIIKLFTNQSNEAQPNPNSLFLPSAHSTIGGDRVLVGPNDTGPLAAQIGAADGSSFPATTSSTIPFHQQSSLTPSVVPASSASVPTIHSVPPGSGPPLSGPRVPVDPNQNVNNHPIARPHPLDNYFYNSGSMLLCELRDQFLSPGFSGPNPGLRGLVSNAVLSDPDLQNLKFWEIPGAVYDLGHEHSIEQLTALLTQERLHAGLVIPERFTLPEINLYISTHFAPIPARGTHDSLDSKTSVELGVEFYNHYQWVDPSVRPLGPQELAEHLVDTRADFMIDQFWEIPGAV